MKALLKKFDPVVMFDEDYFENKKCKNVLYDRFLDQKLYL